MRRRYDRACANWSNSCGRNIRAEPFSSRGWRYAGCLPASSLYHSSTRLPVWPQYVVGMDDSSGRCDLMVGSIRRIRNGTGIPQPMFLLTTRRVRRRADGLDCFETRPAHWRSPSSSPAHVLVSAAVEAGANNRWPVPLAGADCHEGSRAAGPAGLPNSTLSPPQSYVAEISETVDLRDSSLRRQ
jgi:hypothetical protein